MINWDDLGLITTIFIPKYFPFDFHFNLFLKILVGKGAFNSPGFWFLSHIFLFMGAGITIFVCWHRYKYNTGCALGGYPSNTLIMLENRFI